MGYHVYYRGEIEVNPPLSEEHARIVLAVVNMEETEKTKSVFEAIKTDSEPDLPAYGSQLEVSENRSLLVPEEGESRHGIWTWLRHLLKYFFIPHGYQLEGEITWEADDPEDRGSIYVENNHVEVVDYVIFDPGPSWSPNHFADENLKETIQRLLDSADNTGCSDDLTVIAAEHLSELRRLFEKL